MKNFFKRKKDKEELKYDPTNMHVTQLKKGFFVDYTMESYEVQEEYEYEWDDIGIKGREFQLFNGTKKLYLYMETDDDLELSIAQKIKLSSIDVNLARYIVEDDEPPTELEYKGVKYFLQKDRDGHCRKIGAEEWDALVSWEFVDEFDTSVLTIERWGEREFEAAIGENVQEIEFSNIIPKFDDDKKT